MKTISATELARNLGRVLDRLLVEGEEIVIERNREQVARLLPGRARQTALDAMADLHRTLPEDAAAAWEANAVSCGGREVGWTRAYATDGLLSGYLRLD